MAKQVMVVVHADGKMEVNLSGYQGKECDQERLLAELQALFDPGEPSDERKKPEYYQANKQGQTQRG